MDIIINFRVATYCDSTPITMEVKNSRPIKLIGQSDIVRLLAKSLRGIKIETSEDLHKTICYLQQVADNKVSTQHFYAELEGYYDMIE